VSTRNPQSDAIPDFHDGSFDGVLLHAGDKAYLFLTTLDNKQFTLAVRGVKSLHLRNIREGNIVLGVRLIETDHLTEGDIDAVCELSDIDKDRQIAKLLASARQEGLRMLEMTTSYCAEGVVLFKDLELSEKQPPLPDLP
jgi:hypothetical protein